MRTPYLARCDVMLWCCDAKILSYGELKLVDEDLLEGIEIILLVENKHRVLVVKWIDRAKAQRAIAVGNQYGIAGDAGCAFVAIGECLNIRQEHKCQQCSLDISITKNFKSVQNYALFCNYRLIVSLKMHKSYKFWADLADYIKISVSSFISRRPIAAPEGIFNL